MKVRLSDHFFSVIYAVAAGFVAFMSFVGWRPLLPSNIAWLENGDPATFYLGWQFFRYSKWNFPVGLNPDYGIELSNSILFSDSIPFFAILFKLFSQSLPEVFQYFGFWLLLCFVLQGFFAYKLMGLITKSQIICVLGATFFICAPPMIWRVQGHFALVAHFFILASLYFVLLKRLKYRIVCWVLLLVTAALVHPYLLAIAGLLWVADVLGRYVDKTLPAQCAAFELVIVTCAIGIACWQVGYFMIGDGLAAGGFGHFRMNALSIFSSENFSYFLPSIPMSSENREGFNYLGLGIIFLWLCIIPAMLFSPKSLKVLPCLFEILKAKPLVIFAILLFFLFALSNNIGIGSIDFRIELPQSAIDTANIFRASGRMFWPVYYLIYLVTFFVTLHIFSTKYSIFLLSIFLLIQYIDTSKAWLEVRKLYTLLPSSTWETNMKSPFWENAAQNYSTVRVLLPENAGSNWRSIAYFASVHKMPTDAVYLGRINTQSLEIAREQARNSILNSMYDSKTLYFISDPTILAYQNFEIKKLIKSNIQTSMVKQVDGYLVVAPDWEKNAQIEIKK